MKANHSSDPLDQKIDALLANRPLQPSDNFAERVLAAAEAEGSSRSSKKPALGILLKFTLPLAAAIALTCSLFLLKPESTEQAALLGAVEAQEIFLLEDSLSSLTAIPRSEFAGEDLLVALDALYLEI